MTDYKELLDTLSRYYDKLPDRLRHEAMELSDHIFNYSQDKFSLEMNVLEKQKLQCLIRELFYRQLRENYVNVERKIDLNARLTWKVDAELDDNGFYYIESEKNTCPCGFFKRVKRRDFGEGIWQYSVCTCTEINDVPPAQCPQVTSLIMVKIDKWLQIFDEDIKAYLADEMPKLIYITKNPTERYSGFGKQLFNNLSRDTFQHFLTTDKTFQTLCNQLTPSLC